MNLILLPMHSSVSLFSIMSYANNPCAIYEVAIRLEVLYVSCYCSQCRRKMKMNLHVNAFSIATVICKFCF